MMRKFFIVLSLLAATTLVAAHADTVQETSAALEKQLATHDPKAVAAARHYYDVSSAKATMTSIIESFKLSTARSIMQQNPKITPQQLHEVQSIFEAALTDEMDLLLQAQMLVSLDVFTTEELVALDEFYSSPNGRSILAKMPKFAENISLVVQKITPAFADDVKNRIKAKGMELKL